MNPVPHQITHGPSFAMLRCELGPGQVLVAQAGAMVARSPHVQMEVKLNAKRGAGFFELLFAFLIALVRKLIGGETFFVNHFSAPGEPGQVWLAPALSGQVAHRQLRGQSITVSAGAFLASAGDVDLKLKWGGLRALLAREGLFMLEISGTGELWFNSYGGIEVIDVNGSYTVDNGHIVGFEGALTYDISSAGGGVMGFLASGEALVCEFRGQGRVYIQSRNLGALVGWVSPFLPE
jgi:uncharacterized protein (TIGR00266 family)